MAMTPMRATGHSPVRRSLSDFTVDRRILLLTGMAVVVGSAAVGAAWVLLALIGLATNLAWFGRFDTALTSLATAPRGVWMVAIPVVGALIVGLMARYGSEKTRRDLLRIRAASLRAEGERQAYLRKRRG